MTLRVARKAPAKLSAHKASDSFLTACEASSGQGFVFLIGTRIHRVPLLEGFAANCQANIASVLRRLARSFLLLLRLLFLRQPPRRLGRLPGLLGLPGTCVRQGAEQETRCLAWQDSKGCPIAHWDYA